MNYREADTVAAVREAALRLLDRQKDARLAEAVNVSGTSSVSSLRLAALPDDTTVYCAHEYTASNARFALSVDDVGVLLRGTRARGLLPTGGSDWHGPHRSSVGDFFLRPEEVRELLEIGEPEVRPVPHPPFTDTSGSRGTALRAKRSSPHPCSAGRTLQLPASSASSPAGPRSRPCARTRSRSATRRAACSRRLAMYSRA